MAEQQEEGLLEKIYALVAPPQSISSGKQRGRKPRSLPASSATQQKPSGIENNPFCNACGDGGSLLCCDSCPASFHFYCCDPPVDPKDLPSGEWLCRSCSSSPPTHPTPPLFRPLLEQATSANPLIFTIPEELKSTELLPGHSKRRCPAPRPGGKPEEKEATSKLCFACNKRVQPSSLAQCDFCPLHFHLSCVDPPLTTPPSTAWMCPLHPHHSIPDFEHPKLSRRLRALEKGREEVKGHKVKLDFLSKVSRIPHYKRITRHLKRRVTQVPPAVKELYSDPQPEVCETPPLTESLVSAAEVCQWWRCEEEKRRRELSTITSSSSCSFLSPSHHLDQWTRDAVVSQSNHHRHDNHGLHDNLAVLTAATQLLELSRRNGVVKPHELHHKLKDCHNTTSSGRDEVLMAGAVNGVGCDEVEGEMEVGSGVSVKSEGGEETRMVEREEERGQQDIHDSTMCAPDLSLLDPRLVHLLAAQRLRQLFSGNHDDTDKTRGSSPLRPQAGRSINGVRSTVLPPPAKPLTLEDLRSAQSVLCPISGIGTAYPVHKQVTLIGTGSGVEVSLSNYGHCNYLSPRHACIFYNKATGEYELLNYSDHGSVVDGVLYSCDFSDKTSPNSHQQSSAESPIIVEKAREKVERARRALRDQGEAQRALEGALSLSRHPGREEGGGEGSRRTTYNSSVVSIPLTLSRAKKLSAGVPTNKNTDDAGRSEKISSRVSLSLLCPEPPAKPCVCRRSASCLVGTTRKGWEGTATLYHGSRLRFGCLQFVFSTAGKPGHTELLESLSPLLYNASDPT